MARCAAAGLDFRIIPAGFNAPLEFLTGFISLIRMDTNYNYNKCRFPIYDPNNFNGLHPRIFQGFLNGLNLNRQGIEKGTGERKTVVPFLFQFPL